MNMHSPTHHTQAEMALLDAFDRRLAELPGDAAVMLRRDDAIERIKLGLPTRRSEAWHYTELKRLLTVVPPYDPAASAKPIEQFVAGAPLLRIRNGIPDPVKLDLPGVSVTRLSEKLLDGSFAPALKMQDADDIVGAVNIAFVADGFFIDIADDITLEQPLEIQNLHGGGQTHVRMPARIGSNVKATIVQRENGIGDTLVSSVSNVVIGDDCDITWLILQGQPMGVTQLGQFNAWVGKNSRLTLLVLTAGGKLVRQEVRVKTTGEGADFRLRGVNLLGDDAHADLTMVLDHAVPHTSSTAIVRNVVTGRAHGVFQGRINVHQKAQKTDARMACNTLLLSDGADFSTKPELEIFADDVQCGHGATVTEIQNVHLFYLMSRGIDEKTARGLLVKAFVAEVIEELDSEPLVDLLEERLDAWFAAHG